MGKEGKRKRRHYRAHGAGGGPSCGRGVSGGNTIVVAYSTLSIILHNVSRLGLGSHSVETSWKASLPSRLTLGPEGEKGVIGK